MDKTADFRFQVSALGCLVLVFGFRCRSRAQYPRLMPVPEPVAETRYLK
jgi:hypothetical protein